MTAHTAVGADGYLDPDDVTLPIVAARQVILAHEAGGPDYTQAADWYALDVARELLVLSDRLAAVEALHGKRIDRRGNATCRSDL